MSLSETVATAAGIGYKAVELYGTEEFKAEHLEKFVQGTETMALCMADSGAGSDASSASTHAYPSEEGGYNITGKFARLKSIFTGHHWYYFHRVSKP